ncbi:ABC transporter permease subunit [Actinomadura madurae]|uniref:ABC transporter permease n=1 Tax=Actinomadura madurae TaxID=1993 RepID=UPI002026997E|nr:ABC transporter permease subunit [Actinomadura madurae]URM95555.1 ABC transporter permease subunit [Actinomadura madurae]
MTSTTTTAPPESARLRSPRGGARAVIWAGRAALVAVLLAALSLASAFDLGGHGTVPGPMEIGSRLWSSPADEDLMRSVGVTLRSWAAGLLLSVAAGVLLGGLLGSSDFVHRSARGFFDFCRSVPPVALIPLAVLTLGTGFSMKILLIVWVCVWPVLLQTMAGVHDVEPQAKEVGRTLRMSRTQAMRWIVLPSTLPYIGTGIRIAAVMALLVSIGAELLAGADGLGLELYRAQTSSDHAGVWTCVAMAGLLGVVVTGVFTLAERRLTRWQPDRRGS